MFVLVFHWMKLNELIFFLLFSLLCKVKVNGIAEGVGLRVGDVITHVNDIDIDHLSHENIYSSFMTLLNMTIRIYRNSDDHNGDKHDHIENDSNMKKSYDVKRIPYAQNIKPNDTDSIDDDKIAEIISAEAELLDDNVIG